MDNNEENPYEVPSQDKKEQKEKKSKPQVYLLKPKLIAMVVSALLVIYGETLPHPKPLYYQILIYTSLSIFAALMVVGYYLKYKKR